MFVFAAVVTGDVTFDIPAKTRKQKGSMTALS